jgi:hypothetical protein
MRKQRQSGIPDFKSGSINIGMDGDVQSINIVRYPKL